MRVAKLFPNAYGGTRLSDLDRIFGPFFGGENGEGWTSPVSIWSDEAQSHLELELPGVAKEDIDVTVENGQLSITAERKAPGEERQYIYNDRRFGKFTRVFKLPDTIDPNSIKADFTNGVLRLSLSRRAEAQPKKISVNVG